jgi:hypothetical protein
LQVLQDVAFQPIFIIGDHRSGTTLLHRLLAETGCFNYVSAYHVIKYDDVLTNHLEGRTEAAKQALMNAFSELGLKNRIIDNVPVTPDAPVEYGFLLRARRPRITTERLPRFLEICKKVQLISDPSKPLILKNPWDVLNFLEIHSRFPEARFVFIHRHPLFVMNSQLQAIRSLLQSRNGFAAMIAPWYARLFNNPLQLFAVRALASPRLGLWEKLVGVHTIRMARYFVENIHAVPAARYVSIRYEDLCKQPDAAMGNILDFLRATPAAPRSYKDSIEPRPPKILPEVKKRYDQIRQQLIPYLKHHSYDLEPQWASGRS